MTYCMLDMELIESRYEIYQNGDVFDKKRNKYCKKSLDSKGYHQVWIAMLGKNIRVHRLIMCKYNPIQNAYMYQVNHKDGNKTNNKLCNLEWVTQSDNQKHAFRHNLLTRKGENNSQSKLTEVQVKEIIQLLLQKIPIKNIVIQYNVSNTMISRIRNHKAWIELTKDIEFPESKYRNNINQKFIEQSEELKRDLENNVDIDILSKKYHLSKRYIRDFKYRVLRKY